MANLANKGQRSGNKGRTAWQDEELKEFYDLYHSFGGDSEQIAGALQGHTLEECEELCQHYQTFLSLPHNPSLQTAFVGMVKDAVDKASDNADRNGLIAAAAMAAAAAATLAAERNSGSEEDAAALNTSDHQPSFSPASQQHGPFSPSQFKPSSLAHRLAVELNCLSQGNSQQQQMSPGPAAAHYDTGDEEGEQQGGAAGGSQGGRPQRVRKPKQYLGEPVTTPRSTRAGSLPGTPGSSTRRRLTRANSGGPAASPAGEQRGRRRNAGVSAFYGGGAAANYLDSSSAKKRRHRRLFGAEQREQGEYHGEQMMQDGTEALDELAHHAASQGGYSGGGYYGYASGWEDEGAGAVDDDVEEGVDALLSLASMAHASSSCQTDSQYHAGEEPGDYYYSQQQHQPHGGSGRSRRRHQQRGKGTLHSVDEHADYADEAQEEHPQQEQQFQQQHRHKDGGYASDTDAAEDAADGLASMRANGGSQGWGTPKRPVAAEFGIFRTGTPGGVGRASEFLLASPGVSDKPSSAFPLPLPSPSGRRGRPLYGAAAASAAAAAAAGGPKSPAGRSRGRGRGGRRGRGRGSGRGGSSSRAAASGGSSGQRGGSAGAEQDAAYADDAAAASAAPVGGSEADADEEEPELMDAAELAATVSTGPGLSSPHLRTHSASEPPRSVVLLGKRGAGEDGDETPASHRSVRQRLDAGQSFSIPQPLFSDGGAGAVAAGELVGLASSMAAAAAPAQEQQQRRQRGRRGAEDEEQEAAAVNEGRSGRGGRTKRKQQPARNIRKPRKEGRGYAGSKAGYQHKEAELMLSPAEAMLRHMVGSPRVQRWIRYEWHYSAIDRPYFMRKEMQDLLDGLGLHHVTHLTRGEWSVVRSAVGRPRRLSINFLKQERNKLEAYRERVRAAYEAVGVGMEVPADLPRPLKVAQAVVARHPGTRSLHDGIILTIKSSKYRVQFNRSELMTEVVRDTDVMPIDPSEALPLTGILHMPTLLNGRPGPGAAAAALTSAAAQAAITRRRQLAAAAATAAAMQQAHASHNAAAGVSIGGLSGGVTSGTLTTQLRPSAVSTDDPTKTDQQLLTELSSVLDRKEGLLNKLRSMNSTAEEGKHLDSCTHRPAENFQNSYAAVLSNLQHLNSELQGLLARLQNRPHLAALKPPAGTSAAAAARAPAANAAGDTPAATAAAAGAVVGASCSSAAAAPASNVLLQKASSAAADGVAAAAAAAVSAPQAVPSLAAPAEAAGASDVEVSPAAAVVRGAASEAQNILQRVRLQQAAALQSNQEGEAEAGSGKADAAAPELVCEESVIDDVIAGCVSILVTVHKLTSPTSAGDQPQQQQSQPVLGAAGIEAALEAAVQQLRPKSAANQQAYADIMSSVSLLKAQLTRAH